MIIKNKILMLKLNKYHLQLKVSIKLFLILLVLNLYLLMFLNNQKQPNLVHKKENQTFIAI